MRKTIDKEQINQMTVAEYSGEILIVDTLSSVEKAVNEIQQHKIIGFDTETRPSFKKGVTYKVSLLQLSTSQKVYLFRLKQTGFPPLLMEILSNPGITKVGLSVKDDIASIRKCYPLNPESFIELQQYVKQFGIEDNSLQKIYAIVFGEKIRKTERLSNWEATQLTEKQIRYAATDAWACLKLWEELEKKRKRKEAYQRRKMRKQVENN